MLLTLTTTHQPATDLGFLLHKHPERFQTFDLSFGQAHVFYPEAAAERCTACLLLDVDPIGMLRGRRCVTPTIASSGAGGSFRSGQRESVSSIVTKFGSCLLVLWMKLSGRRLKWRVLRAFKD